MTDREERQHVIEVLKSWDGYFIGYTSDEVQEALRYAIASIETDIRYDLLYEETSGQADKQADKPITKNCESCRYYGSHHKVCNYCYKCSLWTEQEPITKNDLAVDAVSRQAINGYIDYILSHGMGKRKSFEFIKKFVANLPPVTPQPRKGYWTEEFNDLEGEVRFTCSSCGKYQLFGTDFCYHCGSDNREVVEE